MKKIFGILIILTFTINASAQTQPKAIVNDAHGVYFTHLSDSAGYQSYYAIEILKKNGKLVKQHYREAMLVRININNNRDIGRWYFKNYPDTIIIQRVNGKEDLIIALKDLKTIGFKIKDNADLNTGIAALAVLGGGSPLSIAGASNSDWSYSYFISSGTCKARIVVKRETEKEKIKRDKIEKSIKKNEERRQKRINN